MRQQRQKILDESATAKAVDYSLKRWDALTRFLEDGDLPIDNNWVKNKSGPLPSDGRTGCSPDHYAQANEQQP
jgi:transposase